MFILLMRIFLLFLILTPLLIGGVFFNTIISQSKLCDLTSKNALSPSPIKTFNWRGNGLVTFWFDDAFESQYTSGVAQLMAKQGWVGAMSVSTGLLCHSAYMTWDQLRELQNQGWEIVSHGVSHECDLTKYTPETTAYEFVESKKTLKSKKFRADHFAIPCGFNQRVLPIAVAMAKKQYASYRYAGDQINPLPVLDRYNLASFAVTDTTTQAEVKAWLNEAAEKKGWLILVFHQIDSRKLRYNVSVEMFKKILMLVKHSELPVVLPTQALQVKLQPVSYR